MKKLLFSAMLILTVFALSATCVFATITRDTDYISFDFTGNTITNSKASDITSFNYVPKDGEANNPFSGAIVYGAFGKDSTDAVYCFTSEWNGSALPTDTSVEANIKNPFMQFDASGMTTTGTNDIVHVSYDYYIDGNGMSGYGELRPYKLGTTSNTRFNPGNSTYLNYSGAGISKFFSTGINAPFKPSQWSRVDVIVDAQAKATVGGAEVDCVLATLYIDGELMVKDVVLDGDNTTDGYQTMGGFSHVRFFLNPKAVNGVFPKTSTYIDNITAKIYRDGTMPVIYPEATLSSSYTLANASVIDNENNIAVLTGYNAADFLSSITASDSYTYNYSIVDKSGNAVTGTTKVEAGDYLRAVNTVSGDVSYYRFIANPSADLISDTLSISDNEIRGYKAATVSEVIDAIAFPYGSTYEIKNADGFLISDTSVTATKGMSITVISEDKLNTKTYTLTDAYNSISVPEVTSAGYATDGEFIPGLFVANVDISNYTTDPLEAKIFIAQYSANGRLKAYGMSSVAKITDSATLTATMNVKSTAAGDFAKIYTWDSLKAPLTECTTLYAINSNTKSVINTYPTYTTKALTFSFDDGAYGNATAGDKRIIDIFNKYDIKATWNLVAGRVNSTFMDNYAKDYFGDGDEVGNHSYAHKRMAVEGTAQEINGTLYQPMSTDECKYEIGEAKAVLENLFGGEVNSLIWPFGAPSGRSDYAELLQYAKDLGIKYARPTGVTGSFEYPADWYNWKQTARIMNPDDYLDKYLALPAVSTDGLKQFSIWGHAYELTYAQEAEEGEEYYDDMDYDELDAFCKAIYDEGETWFTTNIGLCDYYIASNALRNENGVLYNDSDIDLYAIVDGQQVKIPAHGIGGRK